MWISEFEEEYGKGSTLITGFFEEAENCSTEEEIKDTWETFKSQQGDDFDVYELNLIKAGIVNMLKGIWKYLNHSVISTVFFESKGYGQFPVSL